MIVIVRHQQLHFFGNFRSFSLYYLFSYYFVIRILYIEANFLVSVGTITTHPHLDGGITRHTTNILQKNH